ncbi:CAP domain-containing protein [Oceanibium sediminis]|uniref:CAP domain-containing protein n=1 Tax=Oceanibium sediminis TaxID=2026339 RepID=UPI000DD39857|nr:CAP domain-containing protein [Oceanibium sediminis]
MTLICRITLAACLMFAAACTSGTQVVDGVRIISDSEVNGIRTAHVDAVNAFRSTQGQPPVRLNAQLTAAAATHARDMSVQERAWHFGSDGTSPQDRATRAGYAGRVLGENISESFDDEVEVLQSWLNDRFTRRVMLAPEADTVGFAFHQESNGKLWWVQLLGQSGGVREGTGAPGS